MYALWRVIVKEFLQIRRDRRMIPVIFVAPVVQVAVFGFAVNTDVTDVPTVLVDQDRSAASRDLARRFVESGYFEIVASEERADADGYFRLIADEEDARRICGLSPTWLTLAAAKPSRGRLVHYEQYVHPEGYESVGFAGMVFET